MCERHVCGIHGTMADVTDRRRRPFAPDEQSVRLVFALTGAGAAGSGVDCGWEVDQGSGGDFGD